MPSTHCPGCGRLSSGDACRACVKSREDKERLRASVAELLRPTEGDVAIIPLTQGWVAVVDDEDYERLACFAWHVAADELRAYAVRNINGKRRGRIAMHQQVLSAPKGLRIDHVLHRPFPVIDNRRANLRPAASSQNTANSRKRRNAASPFKGVQWSRRSKKWRARIRVHGKEILLGHFTEEAHAAYMYDLAALKHFGEFALVNFAVPGAQRWLFSPGGIQEAA